ncbi:MAG: hypothetical protein AAB394_01040 [Patescibacteria group bacterium]
MATTITKKELKAVVRESVKEAFVQEAMTLRALFLPVVSAKEQRDIEKRYRKPSRRVAKTFEVVI